MALFDNGFKVGTPVLIGLGVLVLAPVILPAAASVLKPLVRSAVKGGALLAARGRLLMAEAAENLADLGAEIREELIREKKIPFASSGAEKVA